LNRQPIGGAWLLTAVLHISVVILFLTVPLQAPRRHGKSTERQGEQLGDTLMFVLGTGEFRAKGPTVQSAPRDSTASARAAAAAIAATAIVSTPPSVAAAPPPPPPPDTAARPPDYLPDPSRILPAAPAAAAAAAAGAAVAPAPQVGDGRLWVSPRPGLPLAVAEALYGDTTGRNQAAMARLKAMVDSLNQVLDQIQRENKAPAWVFGGTPDKPAWGIDPQFIHIAGIKIPTAALALLGNFLPQGNYDEGLRARQLQYMREDLLQAAARAQSFQQFRSYVHELRERKQAERDAEERRRAQDTVKAVP
jgi:hypothetical protein